MKRWGGTQVPRKILNERGSRLAMIEQGSLSTFGNSWN